MKPWPDRFETVLRTYLAPPVDGRPLDPGAPLVDQGLNSLNLVGLLVAIEGEFGFTFPESLVNGETFYSAGTLWSVVGSQSTSGIR